MPTFAFQARTKTGEQVAGTREAADQRAAREALREAELFVTELKEQRGAVRRGGSDQARERNPDATARPPQIYPGAAAPGYAPHAGAVGTPVPDGTAPDAGPGNTVGSTGDGARARPGVTPLLTQPLLAANSKALSLYFRQLHAMLNSGTGIAQAMNTMATHAPSAGLRTASRQISERATAGHPVSEQMKAFPGLFSELQVGLFTAGENGGFLDRMCLRLAEYTERDYELQQSIKRETWYPKLLVFCAILIPASVPTVLAWHGGGSPLPAFIRAVGPPFATIALLWLGWKMLSRAMSVGANRGTLRELLDGAKFVLPIQSKVTRALAAAKFCRAMGALYAAGMGAGKIVDVAAGACGNAAFAARVRKIIPQLQSGGELTAALASTKQFPPVALQMLHTGEASGRIDEQMEKVADFLEADAETAIKQAVKVLGIVVFLAIAIVVGSQIINQYAGIMNGIVDEGSKWAE